MLVKNIQLFYQKYVFKFLNNSQESVLVENCNIYFHVSCKTININSTTTCCCQICFAIFF